MDIRIRAFCYCFFQFLLSISVVNGFGSMGPISAAFGDDGFFCAIDASGKQEIFCWEQNNSSSSSASSSSPSSSSSSSAALAASFSATLPTFSSLAGGEGFMCGISANTSQAYCWNSVNPGKDLVPPAFRYTAYSHISAGKSHVCAVRGWYYSNNDVGVVDCWVIGGKSGRNSAFSGQVSDFNVSDTGFVVRKIVSGEDFSCGGVREGGIVCWGPKAEKLRISGMSEVFLGLSSSRDSICAISEVSGGVKCWGESTSIGVPPVGIQFVSLTAGARHFCGIREDDHGIECWGSIDTSLVPKGSGFLAIAASDFITCGVREDDLIIDCWGSQGPLPPDYSPPLQLCSPGLCSAGPCGNNKFAFNASILNVPDLTDLCVRRELKVCLPCGSNCSKGFFPSSACSENADRVCTACSLCQNSSCWDVCGLSSSSKMQQQRRGQIVKYAIIIGSSVSGFMLMLIVWCFLPRITTTRKEEQRKKQCTSCIGKPEVEVDINVDPQPALPAAICYGTAQVFRLSELKDATNGFKEFNELGRGKYGFVYKAILSDGQQVAVKRANAATIIHTNNREFEAELEVLCKIRHSNIVNLLGYCAEMGERLLVYEFMPHGTLHDHLHGDLSPLNWNLRLKISWQAARGLEYLHKDAVPPIVHGDVKSSNILLDSEWGARIADFGLLSTNNKDQSGDSESDAYNFGVVLLEILSGRKVYDNDYMPPSIVEWALPLIRQGKAAAIFDQGISLPRNVEPLLKFAEIAELALKEDPKQRPTMSDLAMWLEPLVKCGMTF